MNIAFQTVRKTIDYFREDTLSFISLLLALFTSFFHVPSFSSVDWKVIACLFSLMIIVKSLEDSGLLDSVSTFLLQQCNTTRKLILTVSLLSFFVSMFLTNDVAILTFLPLLYSLSKKIDFNLIAASVIVTIAANIGSAATPLGNPQNLYIFAHYQLSLKTFIEAIFPFVVLSFTSVILLSVFQKSEKIEVSFPVEQLKNKQECFIYLALGIFVILSVLGFVPYWIAMVIVVVFTLFYKPEMLYSVDYHLLLTFIFLFIAISNIASIPQFQHFISNLVRTPHQAYLTSIFTSQFISNVPSAILLAPFTSYFRFLLLGLNVGGLGTFIASMANLIALKSINQNYPEKTKQFAKIFTLYNVVLLAIFGIVLYVLAF